MSIEAILMMASLVVALGAWYLHMRRKERADLQWWAIEAKCPRLEHEAEEDWRRRVVEKRTRYMRGSPVR